MIYVFLDAILVGVLVDLLWHRTLFRVYLNAPFLRRILAPRQLPTARILIHVFKWLGPFVIDFLIGVNFLRLILVQNTVSRSVGGLEMLF